jgi:hypothetical protein
LGWLVKVNFLASLQNAYQLVCLNYDITPSSNMMPFLCRFHRSHGQSFENLLLFICKLVAEIKSRLEVLSTLSKQQRNMTILQSQLERLNSW